MRISREDYLQILHPERRDPVAEARRKVTLQRAAQLGSLTLEALIRGIPIRLEVKPAPESRDQSTDHPD